MKLFITLKELKQIINKLPEEYDDSKIVLQKDSEGNGYNYLTGVDNNAIIKDESDFNDLEVYDLSWSFKEACIEENEWEKLKKKQKCIILYP